MSLVLAAIAGWADHDGMPPAVPPPVTIATSTPRRVAIVAYPSVQSLDVAGPLEVLYAADAMLRRENRRGYELGIATLDGLAATSSSGVTLGARWSLADLAADPPDTLLVAGGYGNSTLRDDEHFVAALAAAAAGCRRVCSGCTGAFLLAAAGLLDGRRATTHWAAAAELRELHPEVIVEEDSIYIRDGNVWTSAGVTAGMDLALALVADDHDDELARQVAQWLVVYLRRSGGQSQFSMPVTAVTARRDDIRRVQDRIAADPSADCSVDSLAAMASMSPRHFARTFHEQVGTTPARYVESCRVDLARSLLETTDLTVAEVARRSGIGDASTLHRVFDRRLGTTPAAYRSHFRSTPHTGAASSPTGPMSGLTAKAAAS